MSTIENEIPSDAPAMKDLDPNLVSVITPAYNAAPFIEATIQSVQVQTYPNWEMLILVDQATSDATWSLVEPYAKADTRIRLLRAGKGVCENRNIGFQLARGRYLAFLDSDDLWTPHKLEKQIEFMKSNPVAICYGGYRRMSLDGSKLGQLIRVPKNLSYSYLLKRNPIGSPTALIDQTKTGSIRMGNDVHEDYVLWLRLLREGHTAAGLPDDLAHYRIVPGSRSADKKKAAGWRWRIYREYERLSLPLAVYYFGWYAALSLFNRIKF